MENIKNNETPEIPQKRPRGRPRKEKVPKVPKPRPKMSDEERKEKIKLRNKKIYDNTKDKKIQCECGKITDIYNKYIHEHSKKHIQNIEKQKELKNFLSQIEEKLTNKEDMEKIKYLLVR